MDQTKLSAVIAGVVAAGFLVASAAYVLIGRSNDDFAACAGGSVAGGSIGGPFELIDETGVTVTEREVLDKPSLVYFGYTFCPDVCPLDMARNVEAVEILAERGYDVKPVFVTVDPERDTPEVIAEWTDYLHPQLLGLTGSPEQVKAASQAYRTYYRKQDGDPEYYLVDHSVFTYLMLPDNGFADFFGRDVSAEVLADRTACFIDASQ